MKMKILIVDDDPSVRSVLRLIIEQQGHDVLEAGDGQDGFGKALQHKPDAIISDALMPKMDGFQFLRAVRQDKMLGCIPFVFYTSIYTGDKEYELALSLGADALIVKPKAPADFWKEFTSALYTHASKKKPALQVRLTERDEDHLRDYCRMVAAKLEEKVGDLEMVIADHERTKTILQESEERYRLLFENNPHPMWVYDLETLAFLAVNDAAVYKYGYSCEEFLSMTIKDIRSPEDGPALLSKGAKAYEGFDSAHAWRHRKKDGAIIDVEITSHTMIFAGRPAKLILANDVTERRRLETEQKHNQEKLAQSEQRYRNLVDSAQDVIFTLSSDGALVSLNQIFETITGWSRSESIGRNFTEFVHPEDLGLAMDNFIRVMQGESPPLYMLRILHRSDGYLYGEFLARPNLQNGAIVGLFGIARDITKRKQDEDIIRKMALQHKAILSNIPDIAWLKDKESRFIAANEPFGKACGVKPEDLVGKTDLDIWPKDLAERYMADDKEVMESGKQNRFEEPLADKTGKIVWIETIKTPIYNEKGEVIGTTGIARDITERKRAEDDIKLLNDLFATISQIQSQFILEAGPSVIFDNLLNSILSLTQSEYGFVGEVLYTEDEKPYLRTHAITDIAWNEETKAFHDKYAPNLEFFNLKTLFGEVMVTGRPVVSNNPSSDPRRGGLPQGHPTLDNFLGLPFYHGSVLVGMVGIANRQAGYDDKLVEYLQPLLSMCGSIIESYRNETQRNKAEDMIKESEERYRNLFDSSYVMIQSVAPDGHFVYVNPSWIKTLGYAREDLQTLTIFDILHESCKPHCMTLFSKAMSGEPIEFFEAKFIARDGRLIDVEGNASVHVVDGKVVATQGILRDVTERKILEEQLSQITREWEETFNTITDMVTVHDKDFHIIRANKAAERILGLPFLEVKKAKCFEYFHGTVCPPDGCPSCQMLFFELIRPNFSDYSDHFVLN